MKNLKREMLYLVTQVSNGGPDSPFSISSRQLRITETYVVKYVCRIPIR